MLKKWILTLAICVASSSLKADAIHSQIIELPKINPKTLPGYEDHNWAFLSQVHSPFNRAMEFAPYFNYLRVVYKLSVAIETGTWRADTTPILGYLFDQAHSIELKREFYDNCLAKLAKYPNIHLHFGHSPVILNKLLPAMKDQRLLFYLDAHWSKGFIPDADSPKEWALLHELEEIAKTHRDNCIVVIDDFLVPNRREIPYDSYGLDTCSYDYIKRHLDKLFSDYAYFYVIPKNPQDSRAKFVAIPAKWLEETNFEALNRF